MSQSVSCFVLFLSHKFKRINSGDASMASTWVSKMGASGRVDRV